MDRTPFILADGRWFGPHGIGRFAYEVLKRLHSTTYLTEGPPPLSALNLLWQTRLLKSALNYKIFYTPGFNAPLTSALPFVFTLHDLIHVEESRFWHPKYIFYKTVIKQAAKNAHKIVTVSHYSKSAILRWLNLPEEKVTVVYGGVSACFKPEGARYQPPFPYLLHVGATKPHKNIVRILKAFAQAKIDPTMRLIFTKSLSAMHWKIIKEMQIEQRITILPAHNDTELANIYRGALGLVFPSLHEGFGLPVREAMACGIPVLTANTTSLPEVANNAALLIDPYDQTALKTGIERLAYNTPLRKHLIQQGLQPHPEFTWDRVAQKIQAILNEVVY